MVESMSASVCALETNPASNADGARNTPRASAARRQRANRALSPAPLDLAELGEIGPYAEPPLAPPGGHGEPRHHFVEDQQAPMTIAQRSQRFVESRLGSDDPGVPDIRLDDHRRDFVTAPPEEILYRARVVERHRDGQLG